MPDSSPKLVSGSARLVSVNEASGDKFKFTFETGYRIYMCTGQVPIIRDDEPLWRRLEPVDKPEETE